METVDYLRVARKRLGILIGVPLAAAVVAALVVLLSPQRYAVTSYVAAPALIGGVAAQQFSGQQAANQFVAAFSAAATSPKVIDQVAGDTGVSKDELRDGVEVKQVGASSQLTLTWTGGERGKAAPVARSMTGRALTFLFASQVDAATEQVAAADKDVTAAADKITAWETKNKVTQPDKQFQAILNQQGDFRQKELDMSAVGNFRGEQAAKDAIADGQKQLDELGPMLAGYEALLAQRDAATSALGEAQKGLQAARAQVGAANPEQVSSVGDVESSSRLDELVRIVPPVTGAGLLVAVMLVVLLEIVRRPRDPFYSEPPAQRAPARV
jgi:capsular polysaccharide biosynthesis protein